MQEDFKLEVVNDIAVILRIQGQCFEVAEIYEPLTSGSISISAQQISSHLQDRGAAVIGRVLAHSLMQVVESELGRRLQRDKWLVAVIASMTRNLGRKPVRVAQPEVGLVPLEREEPRGVRHLIHSAVEQVDRLTQRGAQP